MRVKTPEPQEISGNEFLTLCKDWIEQVQEIVKSPYFLYEKIHTWGKNGLMEFISSHECPKWLKEPSKHEFNSSDYDVALKFYYHLVDELSRKVETR